LDELENKYRLGFGIKTDEVKKLYSTIIYLLNIPNLKEVFQKRRRKMFSEKIDYSVFLVWLVENYPHSGLIMKTVPDYQYKFK